MRYSHLISKLSTAKWASLPSVPQAVRDLLALKLAGSPMPSAAFPRRAQIGALASTGNRIAVVPVFGVIGKHLDDLAIDCGGCDIDHVRMAIDDAVGNPANRAVVLHFDSPGGVITGVPELAAHIRALRQETGKPIFAFTDALMASAAYWLASACDEIYCTPSADVGSIGVYIALVDCSEAWAAEGYKLVLVKAGDRKAEGIQGLPIEQRTIDALQADVDVCYSMFTGAVLAQRPDVPSSAMQGQCFMGDAAEEMKLVDGIVPDLQTFLASL